MNMFVDQGDLPFYWFRVDLVLRLFLTLCIGQFTTASFKGQAETSRYYLVKMLYRKLPGIVLSSYYLSCLKIGGPTFKSATSEVVGECVNTRETI